ncbi:hypothetical protein AMELA_G00268190, partial [Ameiurus melas]
MKSGEQSSVISRPPAMRSCMQYDTAHYTVCIIQVGLNPPYCTILDPPWHEMESFQMFEKMTCCTLYTSLLNK